MIAHEYSHVFNGDMRLNIRLMGLLFGILALTVIGRILVRVRGGGGKRGNQLALLGLGLIVIGGVGVFFARWIKAGVSRQREYLADASAVQFTRQTRGLAGALKKIAGYGEGSKLQAPDTEEVSHMLFASGLASRLFATHPPIEARIRRLDPAFNPQIARSMQPPAATTATSVTGANAFAGPVAAADPSASSSAPAAAAVSAVTPEAVVTRIGELTAEHVQRAGALRDALPESLRDAAHDAVGAPVLVLALLLAPDEAARGAQLQRIEAGHGADLRARAFALLPQVQALERLQRLPLAALCLPALRTLDKADLRRLKGTVHALIHADGRVDVAEYALGAMLDTQLGDTLRPSAAGRPGGAKLRQHTDDVVNVLTVFANVGHGGAHTGSRAFGAGLRHALPNIQAPYAPRAQWHENFDAALHRLDRVRMGDKARLLEAIVVTLRHDGVITIDEYELLRSVCALLHCPLPLPSGA